MALSSCGRNWQSRPMTGPSPSYRGYRFPPEIISHAVWFYHRFCLSFRDVEDLLAQRGVTVSYETIRHWCQTFGLDYARKLRCRRGRLGDTWYLDEVFVTFQGRRQYLWRAVDQDGDVLDILVQSRRDRRAAARFFRKVLKGQGRSPRRLVTDKLRSYSAAHRTVMPSVDSQHAAVCEQPRRGFASTDATAGATDAPVQIRRARAAVSLGPRTRAESLPGRATSTSVGAPPLASDAGVRRMGCGNVCLLNDEGYRAIEGSSRPPLINLTVPVDELAYTSLAKRDHATETLLKSPFTEAQMVTILREADRRTEPDSLRLARQAPRPRCSPRSLGRNRPAPRWPQLAGGATQARQCGRQVRWQRRRRGIRGKEHLTARDRTSAAPSHTLRGRWPPVVGGDAFTEARLAVQATLCGHSDSA